MLASPVNGQYLARQVVNLRLLLGLLNHLTRDDEALDLSSALVDLVDLSVTHQLLNGVLAVETVATEDLQHKRRSDCVLGM